MTRSRRSRRSQGAVRLSAVTAAAVLFVLGVPAPASAQCSNPNFPSSRVFPTGKCPEGVATTASATVWCLLAIAFVLWLVLALSRHRPGTNADLELIDAVFSQAETDGGPTPRGEGISKPTLVLGPRTAATGHTGNTATLPAPPSTAPLAPPPAPPRAPQPPWPPQPPERP
ncbi:hypothetical protein [Streptomyces flavidovirens]|uniref:Secreted protein n=1 Tax=Streptomyces flavidovirens TaxID=67298 RepID=A0ABW6RF68_9ACTN